MAVGLRPATKGNTRNAVDQRLCEERCWTGETKEERVSIISENQTSSTFFSEQKQTSQRPKALELR